jgi:4'-phosphopantetheinyl transferase EntD
MDINGPAYDSVGRLYLRIKMTYILHNSDGATASHHGKAWRVDESAVIPKRWSRPAAGIPALTLFHSQFDAASFDARSFRQAGIDSPEHIANAVKKRQAEFYFGRLCARAALGALGVMAVQVASGPMREPLWPPYLVGSITHSATAAAAVVLPASRGNGIGIDLEAIAEASALDALRKLVVSEREYAFLSRFAEQSGMDVLLTIVFSAKESFFKGVFAVVQRYFDFDAIELDGLDLEAQTMSFTVTQALCRQWQPGCRCHVGFELLEDGQVFTAFLW